MTKRTFLALAALAAQSLFAASPLQNEPPKKPILELKKAKGFGVRANFYVQKSNAENLLKSLAARGHDNARIVETDSGDGNLRGFAVLLGKFDGGGAFATRAQAETYLEQLQSKHKKDASLGPVFLKAIVVEL